MPDERCEFKGRYKGEPIRCELKKNHPGQHFVILRTGQQFLVKPK